MFSHLSALLAGLRVVIGDDLLGVITPMRTFQWHHHLARRTDQGDHPQGLSSYIFPCQNLLAVSHSLRPRRNLPCLQANRMSPPWQMTGPLAHCCSVFVARRCFPNHQVTMQKSAYIVPLPYLSRCPQVGTEARTEKNQKVTESVCTQEAHHQVARAIQHLPL